jgi:hypothetical protein
MPENPYQSPVAEASFESTPSIELGRKFVLWISGIWIGLTSIVVFVNIGRGIALAAAARNLLSLGMLVWVCIWIYRGSRIAKWVIVVMLLLQIPIAMILLSRQSTLNFGTALLLGEAGLRLAGAATLIFSKSLNAYLAFKRNRSAQTPAA